MGINFAVNVLMLQEGDRIIVVSPAPNQLDLTISNLKPEDSSNYTCIAENSGGKMYRNGTIIVECELHGILCI